MADIDEHEQTEPQGPPSPWVSTKNFNPIDDSFIGELTDADKAAWFCWYREFVNGASRISLSSLPQVKAFKAWDDLMCDPEFMQLPQNSAAFSKTLAGKLPARMRWLVAQVADLLPEEAESMPFPAVIKAARIAVDAVSSHTGSQPEPGEATAGGNAGNEPDHAAGITPDLVTPKMDTDVWLTSQSELCDEQRPAEGEQYIFSLVIDWDTFVIKRPVGDGQVLHTTITDVDQQSLFKSLMTNGGEITTEIAKGCVQGDMSNARRRLIEHFLKLNLTLESRKWQLIEWNGT